MVVFSGEKGSGKTEKLLEYACDNGLTIISDDAYRLHKKALRHGIFGLEIISIEDYINLPNDNTNYVVHDFEKFMEKTMPDIKGFSITMEKKKNG